MRHGFSLAKVVLMIGTVMVWLSASGAIHAAICIITGRVLEVERYVDFGEVHPQEKFIHELTIRNSSSIELNVVGGTSDCSCLVINVPQSIPPNGSASVQVLLKVPSEARSRIIRWVQLYTDLPNQPRLRIAIGYNVSR